MKPVELNASKPAAIQKQPPEPIDEVPPDARPDGNAEWIPGYWSWDDDRANFLWVSGTWRVVPSGQRWVAGYWTETSEGWVRVPGFWSATTSTEIAYLPEPPQTLEQGPVGDAPSEQHFWIPGSWVYQNTNYNWRPGFWARGNADWMWTPDNYAWTPNGYVYTSGYWDYPYVRRGILFPPVFVGNPIYTNPGYFYTPTVGINLAGLHIHLFARPRFNQFYFGDYYGDSYANSGFYPWFAFHQWNGYDPFYNYYGFRFGRGDRNWDRREEAEVLVSLDNRDRLDRLTARKINQVNEDDRRQIARQSNDRLRDMRERRIEVEKESRVTLKPTEGLQRDSADQRPVLRLPERADVPRATVRDGGNRIGVDRERNRGDGDRDFKHRDADRNEQRDEIPDDNLRGRDVRDRTVVPPRPNGQEPRVNRRDDTPLNKRNVPEIPNAPNRRDPVEPGPSTRPNLKSPGVLPANPSNRAPGGPTIRGAQPPVTPPAKTPNIVRPVRPPAAAADQGLNLRQRERELVFANNR